jgi:ATP-dependent DNA helicase RecQ
MTKREVQSMIQALVRQGYLRTEGLRYPVVAITPEGREVMHNRTVARLGSWRPVAAKKSRTAPTVGVPVAAAPAISTDEHGELREALRGWRSRKASELGVPPYTLFWDRTLDELCKTHPSTPAELLTIWGFGEQKLRTFGAEILAVIAACPG